MRLTRPLQLEIGTRSADGKRSFGAVLSTETPVQRSDWDGAFFEVLSHKAGAVDLSRAPLPIIEAHDTKKLPVGIAENVRIVDGKLRGDVTFGASARAKEIEADVEAKVIRNLSIGYTIEKTVEKVDGKQRTITAIKWTPYEVSVVAIGADVGAGFGRSAIMDNEDEDSNTNTGNTDAERSPSALTEDRERCLRIGAIARKLNIDDEVTERLIRGGVSVKDARDRMLDIVAHRDHIRIERSLDMRSLDGERDQRGHVSIGSDSAAEFRAAASDAILLRAGVRIANPHPGVREISPSAVEIARLCVSRDGRTFRGGGSRDELLRRALTTSDFPLILADVMHKAVMNGYESEPSSHRAWVRPQPVQDFRDQHRVILGSAPGLQQVNEGGEYTYGSLTEDATSYRVAKYGKIVTLSWEAIKNDDLGTFARVQPAMGQAARRLEADTVYALLALNTGAGPTMQDGTALFHANHKNLGAAGAFDAAALGAARALLRKQTALGGGVLSLVPRHLIVPVELEQQAEVLLAQAARSVTTVDAATPQWIAQLDLVVEPRLAANAFYLAADSSQIDTCELGLLEENFSGPVIDADERGEFFRDTYSWKVRHVIGAKFLDWRGIVKKPVA